MPISIRCTMGWTATGCAISTSMGGNRIRTVHTRRSFRSSSSASCAMNRATINGDGEQSRDFVYVEDVVQANLLACVAPHEAKGEAYNVAAGKRSSLNEMYAVLSALFEKDLKPVFGPERKGDIRHSGADISKICKNLGYAPEYDFAKGIKEAIQWYKENL